MLYEVPKWQHVTGDLCIYPEHRWHPETPYIPGMGWTKVGIACGETVAKFSHTGLASLLPSINLYGSRYCRLLSVLPWYCRFYRLLLHHDKSYKHSPTILCNTQNDRVIRTHEVIFLTNRVHWGGRLLIWGCSICGLSALQWNSSNGAISRVRSRKSTPQQY